MVSESDIANMSPEQIMELQKQNCIFCRIIEGKVASKKVFEDEKTIAILDINPANPGHMLILPKEHFAIMPQMPEDVLAHLAMVTKALSNASLKSLKTTGSVVFIANGQLAGQQAPHFMIHLIPRKEGDALTVFSLPKNKASDEEMDKVFKAVSTKFREMMGVKEEKKPIDLDKKQEAIKKDVAKPEPKQKEEQQKSIPPKKEEKELPSKTPNENLSKENIDNLKSFIKSNPQLKSMIKNNSEQLIEILKKNPQIKEFLSDKDIPVVINQIKKEIEEEGGDEMDFDGLSSLLLGK